MESPLGFQLFVFYAKGYWNLAFGIKKRRKTPAVANVPTVLSRER
jgi:hypothetical protein